MLSVMKAFPNEKMGIVKDIKSPQEIDEIDTKPCLPTETLLYPGGSLTEVLFAG